MKLWQFCVFCHFQMLFPDIFIKVKKINQNLLIFTIIPHSHPNNNAKLWKMFPFHKTIKTSNPSSGELGYWDVSDVEGPGKWSKWPVLIWLSCWQVCIYYCYKHHHHHQDPLTANSRYIEQLGRSKNLSIKKVNSFLFQFRTDLVFTKFHETKYSILKLF